MATRYKGEITAADGSIYTLHIFNSTQSHPEVRPIRFSINKDASDNIFQPIVGTSLDITLLSTEADDLSDIWQEDERYWQVILLKDYSTVFKGFLSTDGIEFPYNSPIYEVSVTAYDPLAYLEDLAYTQPNGTFYTGKTTLITIICRCLLKACGTIGHMDVHVNVGFKLGILPFIHNAYIDQDAFLKNDEPIDCKEVLEGILTSIGCQVTQVNGDWFITDVYNLCRHYLEPITYRKYTPGGGYLEEITVSPIAPDDNVIGSQIEGYSLFHVNENQRLRNRKHLYSARVKCDYNFKDQIIPNGEMDYNNGSIANWTITDESTFYADFIRMEGKGMFIDSVLCAQSTGVKLRSGASVEIAMIHRYYTEPYAVPLRIYVVGTSETWYFTQWGWKVSTFPDLDFFIIDPQEGLNDHKINLDPTPIEGDLHIDYYSPFFTGDYTAGDSYMTVHGCTAKVTSLESAMESTVRRTDKESGEVGEVVEVPYMTDIVDAAYNVFYTLDDEPIEEVTLSFDNTESSLTYLAKQRINLQSDNALSYTGDVYGDCTGIGTKKAIGTNTQGYPTRVSWDISSNISAIELTPISISQINTIDIELRPVYENTIKPAIQ